MRISQWAAQFRIQITPSEQRPDNPPNDIVYRVKHLFTTRDGFW